MWGLVNTDDMVGELTDDDWGESIVTQNDIGKRVNPGWENGSTLPTFSCTC